MSFFGFIGEKPSSSDDCTDTTASSSSTSAEFNSHSGPTSRASTRKNGELPPRLPCPRFDESSAPAKGIRILIISDTHNCHSKSNFPRLPPADVILHAGDFTSTGVLSDIENFVQWFKGLEQYKKRIFIAGNHELTLDSINYVQRFNTRFHSRKIRDPAEYSKKCRDVVLSTENPTHYLEDSSIELKVSDFVGSGISDSDGCSDGDDVKCGGGSSSSSSDCGFLSDVSEGIGKAVDSSTILCYGSPFSSFFMDWGFNVRRGLESQKKWAEIPDDTDILLTHGPPYGYGDRCHDGFFSGCEDLLHLLTADEKRPSLRPRLHVFGHIHEDYGIFYNGKTLFVNGCTCALSYEPRNKPILVYLPFDKSLPASIIDY